MAEHTPGPWTLLGKQGTAVWHENEIIAQMSEPRTNHKVARANAQLIACAPELLELAKLAVSQCGCCHGGEKLTAPCFACSPWRAVITKATGDRA